MASADLDEIGGGPALGRVGFRIAATRLADEARNEDWQAIDERARRWQPLRLAWLFPLEKPYTRHGRISLR
jgi:hypothetical protein